MGNMIQGNAFCKSVQRMCGADIHIIAAVFAVLAGWLIVGDKLTVKELVGCAIIFVALIIAQLPNKKETESVA